MSYNYSKTSIFLLTFFLFVSSLMSQAQRDYSKVKNFMAFNDFEALNSSVSHENFFDVYAKEMGLNSETDMKFKSKIAGHKGVMHFKYQQIHKGIPVFGTSYILHERDRKLFYANGNYLPKIDLKIENSIEENEAILKAEKIFLELYKDIDPSKLKESQANLQIIDKYYPAHSNEYALAFEVVIESRNHSHKHKYFIDANSGKTLLDFSLILHQSVEGTGNCKYYGTQDITIDSIAPGEYILRDLERGLGVTTTKYDPDQLIINDSKQWDLVNGEGDEVALDVHYCTLSFYDYLKSHFNWNGLDNEGGAMNPVIHANGGRNFVNAYWNGENAFFGNGDCHRGPLTTAEVVGHEFMHGVTEFTSGLVYRNESGAINESLSDMFGKALELEIDPAGFDWLIGESFLENDKVEPFRSMIDPKLYNDPAFYKGENWRDGGGVHTNSGVGNKWFHLLVSGGSGTNENDETFDVLGLGMDKAAQIVFTTASAYLVSNSDYNDFCRQSKKSAEEIHGINSSEYQSVVEAWNAVGLPYGEIVDDLDLSVKYPEKDFIISTCIKDQFFDFNIVINNNSTTDYLPEYGAKLLFDYGNPDKVIEIDQIIPAGDSLIFNINDLFFFDETKDYNTNVILDFVDYNANNNREFIYVSNSISDQTDLTTRATIPNSECFDDEIAITVYLENQGCSLPANQEIFLSIKDPQGVEMWSRNLNFDEPFGQNSTRIYVARFPKQLDNNSYLLDAQTELDTNLENNKTDIQVRNANPITENYLNSFSSIQELSSTISLTSLISNFSEPLHQYDGEWFFASTGYSQSLLQPACEGGANILFEESNFVQGLTSTMELCVDLQNLINPVLSFEMIHFQNQENDVYVEFMDYATMLRISWEGSDQGEEIILAQEEGKLIFHEYALPQNLSGTLILDFFTLTGTSIGNVAFLEYDVILLDNLAITGDALAVEDQLDSKVKIYPNPASDYIQIKSEHEILSIEIFNLDGKRVFSSNNIDHRINVQQLANGYYSMTLSTADDNRVNLPFVIAR